MQKMINLFVEEREVKTGEVMFATWLKGIEANGFFYGKQISLSNLMKEGEILVVPMKNLTKSKKDNDYIIASYGDPRRDKRLFSMNIIDFKGDMREKLQQANITS